MFAGGRCRKAMLGVFYQPYPEKFKVPESDARSVLPAIPREIQGAGKRCSECSTSHTPRNSYEIGFTGLPIIIPRNSLRSVTQNKTQMSGEKIRAGHTWYWRLRVSPKSNGCYKDIVVQLRLKLVADSSETKIFGNGKNLPLASKILCKNKQTRTWKFLSKISTQFQRVCPLNKTASAPVLIRITEGPCWKKRTNAEDGYKKRVGVI